MKFAQFVLTYKEKKQHLKGQRSLPKHPTKSKKLYFFLDFHIRVKRKSLEISIVYSHLLVSFKLKLSSTFTYSPLCCKPEEAV